MVSLSLTETPEGLSGVILKAAKGESLWVVESGATFKADVSGADALPGKDAFKEAFKDAAVRAKITSGAVSLVLPDRDVTVSILDFAEGLPPKKSDAMELVRWRAAKGLFLKPSQCRVDYKVLNGVHGGGVRVLTATVKRAVVDLYEDVFKTDGEEDGAFTISKIGVRSLGLWNLLADKLSSSGATEKDFVLIVRTGYGFTLMAFKEGVLSFYRSKNVSSDELFLTEVSSSLSYLNDMEAAIDLSRVYFLGTVGKGEALKEVLDVPVEVVDPTTLVLSGALNVSDDDLTSMEIISAVGGLI